VVNVRTGWSMGNTKARRVPFWNVTLHIAASLSEVSIDIKSGFFDFDLDLAHLFHCRSESSISDMVGNYSSIRTS
jgi:hypothetical protein